MKAKDLVLLHYPAAICEKRKVQRLGYDRLYVYFYIVSGEDVLSRSPISEHNAWVIVKNKIESKKRITWKI